MPVYSVRNDRTSPICWQKKHWKSTSAPPLNVRWSHQRSKLSDWVDCIVTRIFRLKNMYSLNQLRTWSYLYYQPTWDEWIPSFKTWTLYVSRPSLSTVLTLTQMMVRLQRTWATAGTSHQEPWNFFTLSILWWKISRHLACCRPSYFSQLCTVYLCKNTIMPSLQSLPLHFTPDFKRLKGVLLPQCHLYSFDAWTSLSSGTAYLVIVAAGS